ncbi:polysaccharide biosynthesis protein [Microaerobacter geothermalis]|uniref:putative polysaccharide biosynthesis protein n=1 Tax=Microaerobacter geothermalis TaxID=674972 RepID=UPI001F1F87E8|nr:polysaccharide biosynthesis protein [Microaerobacter geothermalis]MCF6094694.1 polysaccharide biosynthesis protein [Microaerobacter geothermalis]
MTSKLQTSSFIKGAAILGAAALLSKLLGVVYRIPYQNITGNEGLYVYNAVYPLYSTLLIFATAGIPIAISKMVSERLTLGDVDGAKRIFRISSFILTITGLLFFLALYFGAPLIAALWGDSRLVLPIRTVSYALLIVPFMASLRGYFQGHQNMIPTAVSQISEQIVRVITILVLSYWFINNGFDVYYAGSGAVFGAFTGALMALFVLLFFWRRNQVVQKDISAREASSLPKESALQLMGKILYIALPICLGAVVLPLMQLADSATILNILQSMGETKDQATELKGIYDRGQPLVQFVAFFATSLSLALVPSISEAKALNQGEIIAARTELAMRLTLLLGLPASIGLAVIAEPVNITLYQDNDGTLAMAVLAFTSVFSTLGITSAGILQGLGHVVLPARNLIIGVMFKIALNFALIPFLGIVGAALATVLAYMIATILNMIGLNKSTGVAFSYASFLMKPLTAVAIMAGIVFLVMEGSAFSLQYVMSPGRAFEAIVTFFSISVGAFVYGISLFISGALTRRDLEVVPKMKRYIPFLERFRLLKDS